MMNSQISLQPVDPNFYNPVLPLPVPQYAQPTFLPMVSLRSDGSLASTPGFMTADSSLQKLGSTSSLTSVSPNNLQIGGMSFSASSPLLTQATSPYLLTQPAQMPQCQFFAPMTVSPRFTTPSVSPQPPMVFTTPSVSPQPPMVEQAPLYFSPSPLLLTPQQGSVSSNSTADMPNVFLTGNTFTLLPPNRSFTSSRTPERFVPTNISPARSPHGTEHRRTRTRFRERPMSLSNTQTHRAGYPPKPTSSFQNEDLPTIEGPVAGKRQKKFGYRSKQRKIDRTHRNIQEMFSALGLFAKERELVRGDDTLRIHVKTFEGLTDIQSALNEIHNHKEIEIVRVAAVFSKKNRFQKKGFIVYLKVASVAEVEVCMRLLKHYHNSLRNVAIARAKTPQVSNKPVQKVNLEEFINEQQIPRQFSNSSEA